MQIKSEFTKKRSKREENREKSKQLILRAALELFAQKSYGSTTMEMIADRAGISRGLPYLYFQSKEELLNSILERHFKRKNENIRKIAVDYNSLEEFVEALVDSFYRPFQEGLDSDECLEIRLLMSMMLLPDTKLIIFKKIQSYRSKLVNDSIGNAKELFKKYGIVDFEFELEFIRIMFMGFAFGQLCMGEDFPQEKTKKRLYDFYLFLFKQNQ